MNNQVEDIPNADNKSSFTNKETETGTDIIEEKKDPQKGYQSLYKRDKFEEESDNEVIEKIKKAVLLKKDDPVKSISLDEDLLKKKISS